MTAMIELAQRVDAHVCSTKLEAAIRELRMINELRPTYNFRSRNPEKTTWLTMTNEKFPRLSLSRQSHLPDSERIAVGPFPNGSSAELAMHAMRKLQIYVSAKSALQVSLQSRLAFYLK